METTYGPENLDSFKHVRFVVGEDTINIFLFFPKPIHSFRVVHLRLFKQIARHELRDYQSWLSDEARPGAISFKRYLKISYFLHLKLQVLNWV